MEADVSQHLQREHFTISRELEYFTADELAKQTGYGRREWWPGVIAKEAIDNALDAAEQAGIAPEISLHFDGSRLEIRDNGSGIPPEVVRSLTDFSTRTSDKLAYVSPTRGAQGNAWKTLLAMPYVLDGVNAQPTIIEARGVRHELHVRADHQIERRPRVDHYQYDLPVQKDGTRIIFERFQACLEECAGNPQNVPKLVSDFALFNPHASFSFNGKRLEALNPGFRKWMPTDATPAGWYTLERFEELTAATLAGGCNITVRDFLANFRGLSRTQVRAVILAEANMQRGTSLAELADRSRGEIDKAALHRLWNAMRSHPADIKPEALGVLSRQHFLDKLSGGKDDPSFRYAKKPGTTAEGMPFVVEAAFCLEPKDELMRGLHVGLNWSVPLSNPFKATPFHDGEGLAWGLTDLLGRYRIDVSVDPIAIVLHVAMPRFEFVDRGKGGVTVSPELADAIADAVLKVTQKWAGVKKARDRERRGEARRLEEALRKERAQEVTIIDAAWEVIPEAYAQASDNGRYPAHARQVMYAARPRILEITGKDTLDDEYFTQDLLPRYVRENPQETAHWDVVYDERGHFEEPHTGLRIGIGTLSVREYLEDSDRAAKAPLPAIHVPELSGGIKTAGPHHRFGAVLFIEKEGFLPLLKSAEIAERYDLAIMSSKGMGSTSSRWLLERLAAKARIFVLHDFDKSGFSILGTLSRDTDRYRFEKPPEVIDLGLRLEDVEEYSLESEPVDFKKEDPTENLRLNGATEEEIEFLCGEADALGHYRHGRRVELNALPSAQFVELLEARLRRFNVRKVIPDAKTLEEAFRRSIALHELDDLIQQALLEFGKNGKSEAVPKNLKKRIADKLAEDPSLAWDEALHLLSRQVKSLPQAEP
jgi:DNA topoisomerase VI subunit B